MKVPIKASSPSSLFVYGTLIAPEVMRTLLGRLPDHEPARLIGFKRHPVRSRVYPGMIPNIHQATEPIQGILYRALTSSDMKRLDWFEGEEYTRQTVSANIEGNQVVSTVTYVWTNPLDELDVTKDWSYETFRIQSLDWYLENTVKPCQEEVDRLRF